MIVDSQVHLWQSGTLAADSTHRGDRFDVDDLIGLMDGAGVDRAVLVPLTSGNDLLLDAARAHPTRLAVMGSFPVDRPEAAGLLSHWTDQPGMLGIRAAFLRPERRAQLHSGATDWFWAAAAEAKVPVMVLPSHDLPLIGQLAGRYPDLRLVIDHLGLALSVRDGDIPAALERLWPLADHPNIAVKASALPTYVTEAYPFPSLTGQIRRAVDVFGAERVFWGSDLTRLPCSYAQAVAHFAEELPLTTAERESVMGGAITNWLGWPT